MYYKSEIKEAFIVKEEITKLNPKTENNYNDDEEIDIVDMD